MWRQDGDVHMLPEHGVEHGGRAVDAGRESAEFAANDEYPAFVEHTGIQM